MPFTNFLRGQLLGKKVKGELKGELERELELAQKNYVGRNSYNCYYEY